MKPILILQLRPEDAASNNEFESFLKFGHMAHEDVVRVRMEQGMPALHLDDYSGVIVGGGPWNASDPEEKQTPAQHTAEKILLPFLREVVAKDVPFLGACYGLGALTKALSGKVSKEHYSEQVGTIDIDLTPDGQQDALLTDLPVTFRAMVGHKEAVQEIPHGATLLASSKECPVHMIRLGQRVYATQFHPELETEGLCVRIDVYKHAGYFPPEEADTLKAEAQKEHITVPMELLRRFVERVKNQDLHEPALQNKSSAFSNASL